MRGASASSRVRLVAGLAGVSECLRSFFKRSTINFDSSISSSGLGNGAFDGSSSDSLPSVVRGRVVAAEARAERRVPVEGAGDGALRLLVVREGVLRVEVGGVLAFG